MRLSVPFDSSWHVERAGERVVAHHSYGLIAEVPDLVGMPIAPIAWRESLMRANVPAGAKVEVVSNTVAKNTRWPCGYSELLVSDSDAKPIEGRLAAFFQILWWAGHVTFRSPNWSPEAAELATSVLSGIDLDWDSGEVACLADLWVEHVEAPST